MTANKHLERHKRLAAWAISTYVEPRDRHVEHEHLQPSSKHLHEEQSSLLLHISFALRYEVAFAGRSGSA
jgi:hypothetical protein